MFFAVACGGGRSVRTEGGAVFDISGELLASRADTTVHLGKIRSGEIIQYDAWLRNTDPRPLVIIGVDTSCGCTSVEYEKQPVAPGKKGKLSFRFDSRGMWGTQIKVLEVRTSVSGEKYRIFVVADVEDNDL